MATEQLEAMVTTLEATGSYKILRRLDVGRACSSRSDAPTRIGCVVDVETTGLDSTRDEILQVAIVPFEYTIGDDPRVVRVLPEFNKYRQPSRPISRVITELTGINDAEVAGQRIDASDVNAFMAKLDIDLVVAHNARFDRDFLVRAFPDSFAIQRWVCSLSQVPWEVEAFRGKSLAYLAMQAGFFCRSHDAVEDCRALLALLNHPLPVTGRTALSFLLTAEGIGAPVSKVGERRIRIRALGAPFESKDTLKARGYKWCPGTNDEPKAWYVDVTEEGRVAELAYLEAGILGGRGKAVVERLGA